MYMYILLRKTYLETMQCAACMGTLVYSWFQRWVLTNTEISRQCTKFASAVICIVSAPSNEQITGTHNDEDRLLG